MFCLVQTPNLPVAAQQSGEVLEGFSAAGRRNILTRGNNKIHTKEGHYYLTLVCLCVCGGYHQISRISKVALIIEYFTMSAANLITYS